MYIQRKLLMLCVVVEASINVAIYVPYGIYIAALMYRNTSMLEKLVFRVCTN